MYRTFSTAALAVATLSVLASAPAQAQFSFRPPANPSFGRPPMNSRPQPIRRALSSGSSATFRSTQAISGQTLKIPGSVSKVRGNINPVGLNPQPEPPKVLRLNPQPEPPGGMRSLNPQPEPPGIFRLNPQPEPPG